jgi:uncharacterized membrane protein
MTNTATKTAGGAVTSLGTERLKHELRSLATAAGEKAVGSVTSKAESLTGRLTDYAEHGGPGLMSAVSGAKGAAEGKSPVMSALKGAATGVKDKVTQAVGGGSGGGSLKVTNIVEEIDVGVPLRVAYDQWTQFQDIPNFTKKVESVSQDDDQTVKWRAQILWSHREWESTIVEQIPDERIAWRSEGEKGHVDGVVTFHELAPRLTRILLVLEYHPQGFFEKTGNIWRAQGRRARLELKHFRRHLMSLTSDELEEIDGWRGEIRDGEVVKSDDDARKDEKKSRSSSRSGSGSSGSRSSRSRPTKKSASSRTSGGRSTRKSTSGSRATKKSTSSRSGSRSNSSSSRARKAG